MSQASKIPSSLCYFCGAPATTNDHLPPGNTFPDPKPINLITVPSCDIHNTKQSKDDEYFGIIIKTASGKSPIAESMIKDKVVRGFLRRPALLRSLMKRSRTVELTTPSGLVVGTAPAFEYKRERIATVVTRMTRGFYFKFCGQRLPNEYDVKVFPINPTLDEVAHYFLTRVPLIAFAPGVFSFKYQQDGNDPFFSVWFFMFYEQTLLVSLTMKE
ncbi:MAG: hypothetical protein QME52_01480 [Bacteroidota bacterium]|nr:hypothetical protein [Bacteroidota bacterium]